MIEADAGSTITIGGTIDNTGLVFVADRHRDLAITGTVDGGTVDAGTGTNLVLAGSTLDRVTLERQLPVDRQQLASTLRMISRSTAR